MTTAAFQLCFPSPELKVTQNNVSYEVNMYIRDIVQAHNIVL